MTGWDDLVTTALLGTDRKPLPDGAAEDDPTRVVLAAAARHRAASPRRRPALQLPGAGTAPGGHARAGAGCGPEADR